MMPKNSNPTKSQRERFIEAARAIGADEDEAVFKAKLAVIARHKPKEVAPPVAGKKKPGH